MWVFLLLVVVPFGGACVSFVCSHVWLWKHFSVRVLNRLRCWLLIGAIRCVIGISYSFDISLLLLLLALTRVEMLRNFFIWGLEMDKVLGVIITGQVLMVQYDARIVVVNLTSVTFTSHWNITLAVRRWLIKSLSNDFVAHKSIEIEGSWPFFSAIFDHKTSLIEVSWHETATGNKAVSRHIEDLWILEHCHWVSRSHANFKFVHH